MIRPEFTTEDTESTEKSKKGPLDINLILCVL